MNWAVTKGLLASQGWRRNCVRTQYTATPVRLWSSSSNNNNNNNKSISSRGGDGNRKDGGTTTSSIRTNRPKGNSATTSTTTSSSSFRPRRRPNPAYRPIRLPENPEKLFRKKRDWSPLNDHKFVSLDDENVNMEDDDDDDDADDNDDDADDGLESTFGPLGAQVIREVRRERMTPLSTEEETDEVLRMADYLTAREGTVEDLIHQRRGLSRETSNPAEAAQFMQKIEYMLEEGRNRDMRLLPLNYSEDVDDEDEDGSFEGDNKNQQGGEDLFDEELDMSNDPELRLHPNQLAHGDWSEMLVTVDRNIKLWRGGRLESYRALVVGGNLRGCGGFGVAKSSDPILAVDLAGRRCKRNIFFVEAHQGNGLTRDLVGKQNSCKVFLRATDNGLRGNLLVGEILKRFGIVNVVAKAHGNRNPFNVVRATFKALITHESLEDIALKRGKRLVSLDRSIRMQV